MKKILFLMVAAFAIMIFPNTAQAADNVTWDCGVDAKTKLLADPPVNVDCDFYIEPDAGKVATKVEATIIGTDVEIVTVTRATGWSGTINQNTPTAGSATVAINHTGISTRQKMFTVTFKRAAGAVGPECGNIYVEQTKITQITPEDPKSPEDPKNPETGSTMSYIAIGTGIALASGAIYIASKRRKVYNI